MKKLSLAISLLLSTSVFAHEPYIAPLSYTTDNTQVALVAGYAEEALNSEHALKDNKINVINPANEKSEINLNNHIKSVSVADLELPKDGTYLVETKVSFPLNYVLDQGEWKMFFDMPAEKAPKKSERDFVIPSDLKSKNYKPEKIVREWTLQSYITKNKASTISNVGTAPIQVVFSNNPTQLKAQQAQTIKLSKDQKPLANADIHVRAKGATDKQATQYTSNANGEAVLTFPQAGEYLIEVTEANNTKVKPKNQYYTIISVAALPNT